MMSGMKDDRSHDNKTLVPLVAMGDLVAAGAEADRVERILQGLALVAVQVVRGAEDASLTLLGPDGKLSTPFFTGSLADKVDAVQYAVGEGPCLDAANAHEWTAMVVRDLADPSGDGDTRWPTFRVQGAAAGARSVLSVSLFASSGVGLNGAQKAVGSLNIYASTPGAFGESERDTALLLALYAGLALAATEAVDDSGQRIDQLKEAIATRTVIGQAQGILMERHKFTAGQAFDRLRTASMNLNRKLRDVAKELTETGEEFAMTPHRRVASAESARMSALSRYDILDTPPEASFDRVAAIAAKLFGVPMATVSIVDTDRVWFKASVGLAGVQQVGRDPGLCAAVIMESQSYVVSNARMDPRTAMHPLVTGEPGVQFYAAAPIVTSDGHRLGTVCVMDTEPHEATSEQLGMLEDLAGIVMDELELRLSAMNALRDARAHPRSS
jgi:GAF domain-containing protein